MSTTRIKKVIQDSEASVDRSLSVAEQTRQIGIDIVEELQHQGQQLKQAEENVDNILYQQKEAKKHLSAIRSIFGVIANKFSFRRNKIKHAKYEDTKIKKKKTKKLTLQKQHEAVKVKSQVKNHEPIDHDLLDFESESALQRTNKKVEKISEVVDDLKQIAIKQGEEIDAQNASLPRLQKKITEAHVTMETQITWIKNTY